MRAVPDPVEKWDAVCLDRYVRLYPNRLVFQGNQDLAGVHSAIETTISFLNANGGLRLDMYSESAVSNQVRRWIVSRWDAERQARIFLARFREWGNVRGVVGPPGKIVHYEMLLNNPM